MRARRIEFINLKQEEVFMVDYICKFNELSHYEPHIVATNELKVDQFMQGLRKITVRDLKSGGIKSVPFIEITNMALDAKKVEKETLDEEKVRKKK